MEKEINGVMLEHYENKAWVSLPGYSAADIKKYTDDGFVLCSPNGTLYEKIIYAPKYSSQCPNAKSLGQEPLGCGYSVQSQNTYTHYYSVSKSEYDNMAVKPELTSQCIPLRLYNFDGFTDVIQEERHGMGWEEIVVVNYHTSYRRIFFVSED